MSFKNVGVIRICSLDIAMLVRSEDLSLFFVTLKEKD
jgi:hypothetical protein